MDCGVCEENPGESVKVEYTDGNAEELVLCDECMEDFTDGDLIREVEELEAE